jgi:SAM-dependent methyltransferase
MHGEARLRLPLVPDRRAFLVGLASRRSGLVAHLGCTDSPYTEESLATGSLLHGRLLEAAPGRVVGWDVDLPALDLLRSRFPAERFVSADLLAGVPDDERGRYGFVIAGEVLEHVEAVGPFLRACRALLAPGAELCVTVPNACCPKIGLRALAGRESVHPDHWAYYSPRTLRRALAGADLEAVWMATNFVDSGRFGRAVVNPLLRLAHRRFQGPVGDGLMALARART